MNDAQLISAQCYLSWQSDIASHKDWQYFHKIDLWRDILPCDMAKQVVNLDAGESIEAQIDAGEIFPLEDERSVKHLKYKHVNNNFLHRNIPGPYIGRFYPKGILANVKGSGTIYPEDMRPFRVTDIHNKDIEINMNHPLAKYDITTGLHLEKYLISKEERGGQCNDIVSDIAMNGSGMQCLPDISDFQYIHDDSFKRMNEMEDQLFYYMPRMVNHIDKRARQIIASLYKRHINSGMQILDLMSSWESHMDDIDHNIDVIGLGMNRNELDLNHRLSEYKVHDLNKSPHLPYPDQAFDVIVCTVSIEYLTQPYMIFDDVARILKPGGKFIITFSDRWFPEKVIKIWTELHPFERMGLVLHYFRNSEKYKDLKTESYHGWLRPANDKYFPNRIHSDPVYAVIGTRK